MKKMKKMLLLSSLILSSSVLANTEVYKLEKEEKGEITDIITFEINKNEQQPRYVLQMENINEEEYLSEIKTVNEEANIEYVSKKIKLGNKISVLLIANILTVSIRESKKIKEDTFKTELGIIKLPELESREYSGNINLDDVSEERELFLKNNETDFFISKE